MLSINNTHKKSGTSLVIELLTKKEKEEFGVLVGPSGLGVFNLMQIIV